MIWIGGGPGAGKSTLARRLSRRYDLPLHPIDLWSYDHAQRLGVGETLEDELRKGPEYAADAFQTTSRARLPLVRADIQARKLGAVPALVEGPQLFPQFAACLGLARGFGVWLIPTPIQTRRARESRILMAPHARARSRLEGLLARNLLLSRRVGKAAHRTGYAVVGVSEHTDWSGLERQVEAILQGALSTSPHLSPGLALAGQRRRENRAALRQGRLWQRDAGLAALPPYPFASECGRSGCEQVWRATPDEYEVRTRDGPLIAHEDTGL